MMAFEACNRFVSRIAHALVARQCMGVLIEHGFTWRALFDFAPARHRRSVAAAAAQ